MPALAGNVHHVAGDQDGCPELQNLAGEIEVSFEIGGIDDQQDGVGAFDALDSAEQQVAGDFLVRRAGGQAIRAGKIEQDHVGLGQPALALLDRHAGVITDPLTETGQSIEDGCLTRVRVAGHGDSSDAGGLIGDVLGCGGHQAASMMTAAASDFRTLRR